MTPKSPRRATTLSISLTRELAAEVAGRVSSGLYTSASELIREALRLLLRTEAANAQSSLPATAVRFREASEMMDLGLAIQLDKARRSEPGLQEAELQARLIKLADAQAVGPGLRNAPERLRQLKLDGQG